MGDTLLTSEQIAEEEVALKAFRESIPESYREDPAMAVIKSMDGLVKSYIAGQKIIGVPTDRLVTKPNPETAEQSDWDNYHNQLGRPSDAAGYKLQSPKELPDGITMAEGTIGKLSELFYKHGLTPRQAQGIFDDYNQITISQINDNAKASELHASEAITGLKKEWGGAWDAKLDKAKRAMVAFGDETFRKWLDETKLGDDPVMLRIFSSIGEKLMESTTDGGDGGTGFRKLSPAEAKAEISQLQADENFIKAYTNQQHAGHKDAVDKMTRLFEYANPEDAEVT